MRKIKSIHQLQAEKKRLKQQQAELENKLRDNWGGLKDSLKPAQIAKEAFSSVVENKMGFTPNGESILKNTLHYGIALLAKKITTRATEKLDKLFGKDPRA